MTEKEMRAWIAMAKAILPSCWIARIERALEAAKEDNKTAK